MVRSSIWAVAVGLAVVASGSSADDGDKGKSGYVHTVVFYLKEKVPEGQAKAVIRDAHELLSKIPSVRTLRCGRPAKKSTPKVALKAYDVGLCILFDDYEGLKTYLEHPLHLKFVERHEQYFKRVFVYDFIDQSK